MAGPVASYIQLPIDTANTGKKNRTQTKVVGSDTVHEHFMVPSHAYTKVGRYVYSSSAPIAVSATSQSGTGSGFQWMHLTTTATVNASIKEISVSWSVGGTVVVSTACPQICWTKFTFNTAFSNATTLTALPWHTTATANQFNIRSTSSGATITLKPDIASWMVPALISTAGVYGGHAILYKADDPYTRASAIELTAGEGLVIYQPTAGVSGEVRQFVSRVVWDEIDLT